MSNSFTCDACGKPAMHLIRGMTGRVYLNRRDHGQDCDLCEDHMPYEGYRWQPKNVAPSVLHFRWPGPNGENLYPALQYPLPHISDGAIIEQYVISGHTIKPSSKFYLMLDEQGHLFATVDHATAEAIVNPIPNNVKIVYESNILYCTLSQSKMRNELTCLHALSLITGLTVEQLLNKEHPKSIEKVGGRIERY